MIHSVINNSFRFFLLCLYLAYGVFPIQANEQKLICEMKTQETSVCHCSMFLEERELTDLFQCNCGCNKSDTYTKQIEVVYLEQDHKIFKKTDKKQPIAFIYTYSRTPLKNSNKQISFENKSYDAFFHFQILYCVFII